MKKRLKKSILILLLGFVLLFIFRLGYGYTKTIGGDSSQTVFFESINNSKRNYASKKYKGKSRAVNPTAITVDQKYEKIAEVNTRSAKFEKDEDLLRESIKQNNALIQFEQKNGNKGHQKLHLLIGVPPENFDSLYNSLTKIGKVQSKQITKKDKTNEYKELNAKKASLEKIRTALIEVKTKGGKIEEYIDLENRILEIEQQLQALGVDLGDFDGENEFCTVKFSLNEKKEVSISFMHRLKVALEWTVKIYLRSMVALFFLTLFAYFALLTIDQLKVFDRFFKQEE